MNDIRTFNVIYTDDNNIVNYERYPIFSTASDEDVAKDYARRNPDRNILGFFNENSNLVNRESIRRNQFAEYCYRYGFEPNDFNRRVYYAETETLYRLIGFRPQNHKYKVLLQNEKTGRYTKTTIDFVKRNMI